MNMPILNKLSKEIQLNSLFIQPTYWCGRNCPGCYVKQRNTDKEVKSLALNEWAHFINKVITGTDVKVNELTVSMDDFSHDKDEYFFMKRFFETVIASTKVRKALRFSCPKVNMTFHTIQTLVNYIIQTLNPTTFYDFDRYLQRLCRDSYFTEEMFFNKILSFTKHLDMISFSDLDFDISSQRLLKEIRNETNVNYNLLIPRTPGPKNIDHHIEHLITASEHVDHIYLVIYKDPIGRKRTERQIQISEKHMKDDLYYLDYMNENLPRKILSKIDFDGCLEDIKKYKKTGFGCSANISKMQVWPDGKVTGCAYADASVSSQKTALRATDIINNMRDTQKRYDFKDIPCHLVKDYTNCLKKPSTKHLKRFINIIQDSP